MTANETQIEVRNLSTFAEADLDAIADLEVSAEQEIMGGSFVESLDAWRTGPADQVLGLGFLAQGQSVGMTLFKRPPLSPCWVDAHAASIHGLKIAQQWQGRGWGHLAFRLAVSALKDHWPATQSLMLSVDAVNAAALAVYRGYGMTDIGPTFRGRHGPEYRLRISLSP